MKRIPLAGSRRVALVSDCDYLYLRRFNWCLHSTKQKTPYAQARVDGRNQLMHRVIAVRVKRLFSRKIDHRDRNGLNCQRCNLRRATSSQNGGNQTKHRNNTSGYKGVTWFPKCNKWRAQIKFHGKVVHLGLFTVKRRAAQAYDIAARCCFKDRACFNHVAHSLDGRIKRQIRRETLTRLAGRF